MFGHHLRSIIIVLAIASAACDPVSSTDNSALVPQSAVTDSSSGSSYQDTISNRYLREMARKVPGFGGFFLDSLGRVNVYLKDASAAQAAQQALAEVYRQPMLAQADLVVRGADYEVSELIEWARIATDVVGIPGVVMLDVAEHRNRLYLRISEKGVQTRVAEFLQGRGLPPEAVEIEVGPGFKELQDLEDHHRPLIGGIQIAHDRDGILFGCTLGANVKYNGNGPYFLTNSHCTRVQGQLDPNYLYWQPSPVTHPTAIGREVDDPPYWSGYPCPAGRYCKYGDIAVIEIDNFFDWGFPYIARTSYADPQSGSTFVVGDLEVSYNYGFPYAPPVVGMRMDKMGKVTGWTYGEVKHTCATANVDGKPYTYLCQYVTEAGNHVGDSGAPVFRYFNGDGVGLYGFLWGGDGQTYVWSLITNFEHELNGTIAYH